MNERIDGNAIAISNKFDKTGGTLTGNVYMPSYDLNADDVTVKTLNLKSGGTTSGFPIPTQGGSAATKEYVDAVIAAAVNDRMPYAIERGYLTKTFTPGQTQTILITFTKFKTNSYGLFPVVEDGVPDHWAVTAKADSATSGRIFISNLSGVQKNEIAIRWLSIGDPK